MKNEMPAVSELRQYLDVLGAQLKPGVESDPILVMKTCQLVAMAAADKTKTMPLDVFGLGLDDDVARAMLASFCLVTTRTAMQLQMQQMIRKKIIVPNGLHPSG